MSMRIHNFIESTMQSQTLDFEVEIDETLIARRKYERGRIVEQNACLELLKEMVGDFFLKTVERRDATTLGSLIRTWIREDSVVYSDEWLVYARVVSEYGDQPFIGV